MRIAICCPVHGDVRFLFAHCLSQLLIRTAKTKFVRQDGTPFDVDIEVFFKSSSVLPTLRRELVATAAEWKADWILWLDSDHTFPSDALLRLLSHHKPVVGCNYPRRIVGTPVARSVDGSPFITANGAAGLDEAGSTGLGLCLVSMEALRATHPPLFAYTVREDGGSEGEDVWFFQRLREAGYPLLIDQALSLDVGHISEQVLSFGRPETLPTT